jgi:hypothetical protein
MLCWILTKPDTTPAKNHTSRPTKDERENPHGMEPLERRVE